MEVLTHLKELTSAPGVSGFEKPAREVIRAAWAPLTAEIHVDRLGALLAVKPGGARPPVTGPAPAKGARPAPARRPKIMLAAHMDTIGLMVSKVEGEFLRVTPVGGVDARALPGQLVTVHGREDLPGLIVQPPAFLLPPAGRDGGVSVGELLIDCGLPADRLAGLVRVGDAVSFAQPPRELQSGHLSARYLDNRASVAALTVCLEALRDRPHAWDVIAVATVQEEVGVRGALASAFALSPDLAIAVDVTFGSNGKDGEERSFPLGGGPTLGIGPNIHPGLLAALRGAAEGAEIPCAIEPLPMHSGTDAIGLQVAREGIPTAVVGIPLRNMHTPVEVVALRDVTRAGRLLAEFIAGLEPDFLSRLTLD